MQHSKAKEKFRRALPLGKKDNVRVQHAKAQAEFREAMTPEEKQEVKLQHAQAKTQRITILTADEKAKEIAALEGLGELQRTYDTRGQTGS